MIKVEKTKRGCEVAIAKVNGPELMTEFSVVVESVHKTLVEKFGINEEDAKEMLKHSFDSAFKTAEELKKELEEEIKGLLNDGNIEGLLKAFERAMKSMVKRNLEEAEKELTNE